MATMTAKALGVVLFSAVAMAATADFPPLSDTTPTGEHFPGKFIWADLFTTDPAAAQAFYTGLFGWEATTIEHPTPSGTHAYIVLANGGEPVAGLAGLPSRMQDAVHGRWVGYVSVPDVGKALTAATARGGRVLFPAKDLPRRGTQAIFVDPEGAELGVLHSSAGDPGEYAPDIGDWTWAQLFARDPAAEDRFYASVTGWDVLPDTRDDRPDIFVLASGGYSRASVAPLPPRGMPLRFSQVAPRHSDRHKGASNYSTSRRTVTVERRTCSTKEPDLRREPGMARPQLVQFYTRNSNRAVRRHVSGK